MKIEWEVSTAIRNIIFIVGILILAIVFYYVFLGHGIR